MDLMTVIRNLASKKFGVILITVILLWSLAASNQAVAELCIWLMTGLSVLFFMYQAAYDLIKLFGVEKK